MYPLLYTIIRDTWSTCAFSFEVTADRKKAESSPRRTALSWSLSDPEWGWMTKQKFNINFCKLCGTFLDFEPSIFTATLFVQLYWELLLRKLLRYCWFSHDVTKIQTKKLSILPWFYFHDALEHCWFSYKFSLQKGSCFCGRVRLDF